MQSATSLVVALWHAPAQPWAVAWISTADMLRIERKGLVPTGAGAGMLAMEALRDDAIAVIWRMRVAMES